MKLFGRKTTHTSAGTTAAASSNGDAVAVLERSGTATELAAREKAIKEIGSELLGIARKKQAGLLSARFYQDKLMDWSMKDQAFKVQLFRFVDTFPVLHSPELVHSVLTDYLSQPNVKLPPGMGLGLKTGGLAKGLVSGTISSQIKNMAGNFIAGTDAKSALPQLKKLWESGIAFSVDLLGEACVSDEEADMYRDKYLDLVINLPRTVQSWQKNDTLETDHIGDVPRTNVSVKVSALCAQFDPIAPKKAIADLMKRLVPILEAARDNGVFINFDMEQAELKDLTLDAFFEARKTVDFEGGLAMQAYLRSGIEDAERVCKWAKENNQTITVRLVKGAYWDYEVIHAEEQGWPAKVWTEKWATDACFEQMSEVFLDHTPRKPGDPGVKLALGSHNARSIAAALEGLERRDLPRGAIELQMLHGMADELKKAAADHAKGMGLRVREYVPVGEMIPGMAYLVRRLLENTSNESWLRAGFLDEASEDVLLARPAPSGPHSTHGTAQATAVAEGGPTRDLCDVAPERHALAPAVEGVGNSRGFFNEPLRDFSKADVREAFAKAIKNAKVEHIASDRTPEQGREMVAKADAAFAAWRDTDPIVRANVLERVADMMAARRDELSGIVLKECGKTWREADGDVCEAIDFCRYYARLAPELFSRQRLGKFIGELDELWYQPRGIAAVISPWNFPLAICCGMTVAALVTGNTVVLKPAEQSVYIAKVMTDMVWQALDEAGASRDVLQFCPAPGESTGAAIVRDPRIALLAFTGSKAVGLDIIAAAGNTTEEQAHVKRVVCEMGGKNAIIVDATADLDEAVLGVRYSAFGYSGQKCSACSRCIVVDPEGPDGPHASLFRQRLVEATRSLVVGDPTESGTDVATVIDNEAAGKIESIIDTARRQGEASGGCELILEMGATDLDGSTGVVPRRCIHPHIFDRVRPDHMLAQVEVFGPVLAVMYATTFDEALEIANDHQYKLTGAVFTRTPLHITRAKNEFRVGNLYINRGSTGALVGRQPFGGFGMSGIGSKAGGPEYLFQFVEPRASCENTMRRGFAPEL
ncbi:MAG: proline dehydrogenase family protein [Planctomycetota bacterium]